MNQPTTALRKIASMKERIRAVRGSQGSSKTYSILMLLANHASSQHNREIYIISEELTKMRRTVIKDFVKIMQGFNFYDPKKHLAGTLYKFDNGSFIQFLGADKDDIGKGMRSHVAYFNEVNKIDFETFNQIESRADVVYCDYNPDAKFWLDEEVLTRDDAELIQLTYKDNEYLPKAELNNILRYKQRGYDAEGNIINKYWANKWQVYGLGNIGSIDGVVFEQWETISSIPQNARLKYYGVDFGFSISKFACVAVWYMDGKLIVDEIVYKNNLTNPQASQAMKFNGYKEGLVYCDSAEPKSIQELKNNGINAVACENKRDIKTFAIQKLNTDSFFVTERSVNLINELRYLVWDEKTGKPKKSDKDHLCDALMYCVGSEGKYSGTYL